MKLVGIYSFNNGKAYIEKKYPTLLREVKSVIKEVDAPLAKTKKSLKKTMPGKILFNPRELNAAFKTEFEKQGWQKKRVSCDYSHAYYLGKYKSPKQNRGAFRELDFLKSNLGVEVQFGKYAFMVYNVCAKMTIFNKLKFIDASIEIVPIKEFADQMSTGVSYFEQFVWDLENRGVSNIDIPVLILGINK